MDGDPLSSAPFVSLLVQHSLMQILCSGHCEPRHPTFDFSESHNSPMSAQLPPTSHTLPFSLTCLQFMNCSRKNRFHSETHSSAGHWKLWPFPFKNKQNLKMFFEYFIHVDSVLYTYYLFTSPNPPRFPLPTPFLTLCLLLLCVVFFITKSDSCYS